MYPRRDALANMQEVDQEEDGVEEDGEKNE
jgi:hypothetical protein